MESENAMILLWMAMRERPDKKYDSEELRKTQMSLGKALTEILNALAKLKYELFLIRENSISLMKYNPKEDKDLFILTVIGQPEEIRAIQLDERIKGFFR